MCKKRCQAVWCDCGSVGAAKEKQIVVRFSPTPSTPPPPTPNPTEESRSPAQLLLPSLTKRPLECLLHQLLTLASFPITAEKLPETGALKTRLEITLQRSEHGAS